jgi:uncharacterized repeat protein (TIGR02543 family)
MKNKLTLSTAAAFIVSGFFFSQGAFASTINVASGELNFGATPGTNDQPAHIGAGAANGFSYRYDDVFSGVDAVATVIDVTNINSGPNTDTVPDGLFDQFDELSSTSGKSINVDIDIFGASGAMQSGSVTIRIDFVAADTTNAVTLQNISMLVKDIDSRQYATFAGISSYELSSGTAPSTASELTVTSSGGAYEFKEPTGATSDSVDEENWVAVDYSSASSITFTLGARESGGAFFGVSFIDASWPASPVVTPVSLTEYSLTYDGNSATSGTVPTTQNSTTSSSSVTLSAPQGSLLRTNCTFGGWNTRADGTGANFLDAGTINLTANTTLYAKWTCTSPPSSAPAATATPTAVLAVTGWDASGAWILSGALIAAGLSLVSVRRLVGRQK